MGWRRLSSTSKTYFIIIEFRVGAPIAPTSHSCVYTAGEGKTPGSGKKHKNGSGFRGGQLTLEVLPLCPASTPCSDKAVRQDEIAEGAFEAVAAQVRVSRSSGHVWTGCAAASFEQKISRLAASYFGTLGLIWMSEITECLMRFCEVLR